MDSYEFYIITEKESIEKSILYSMNKTAKQVSQTLASF